MLKRLSCSLSFSVFTPYPTQLPIIPLWCLVPSMVIMRYHHKSCLWSLAACVYVYFCFVCYVLICILNVPKQFSKWLLSVNFSDAVSVKLRLWICQMLSCIWYLMWESCRWFAQWVVIKENKRVIELYLLASCVFCVSFLLSTRRHAKHSPTFSHLHDSVEYSLSTRIYSLLNPLLLFYVLCVLKYSLSRSG